MLFWQGTLFRYLTIPLQIWKVLSSLFQNSELIWSRIYGTGDHQLISLINQSEIYGFTLIDLTIRRPQTLKRHERAITNSPYIYIN